MVSAEEIAAKIKAAMPEAVVDVRDPHNDGTHLEATVTSPAFVGKTRIQQHKMVYAALGDAFATNLHALQLTTKVA